MDRPCATTTGAALRHAAGILKSAGISGSRNEAEIILAAILETPRWKLIVNAEQEIPPHVENTYKEAIMTRADHCPLAYILQRKEFYGTDFHVSPDVLIPRPETEFVVEAVTAALAAEEGREKGKGLNIIEMGTGSGAIVITLARLLPEASFLAVDISGEALDIARKNALAQGVDKRIRFLKSDYWEIFNDKEELFDVIISNPPYIPSGTIKTLSPTVRKYEPLRSLDGGKDGLDGYRSILSGLQKYASRSALLVLEVGVEVADAVKALCQQEAAVVSLNVVKDYQGHDRVIVVRLE